MATRGSKVSFQLFRFQILPHRSEKQMDIESPVKDVRDIKELKERKNEFFLKALLEVETFDHAYSNVTHKIIHSSNDRVIIKMASQKDVELTHKDFSREEYEDWPPITIYIDNRPNRQVILIQNDRKVFSSPEVVANILQNNINDKLHKYFLATYIKPIFEEHEFWSLVSEFKERIKSVNFELISPNLANISNSLELDLGQLNEDTNTHKTNLELNSDGNSYLEIDEDNEMIDSLVEYSAEGGGDISMRVKGIRKKIHTKNTIKEIDIEELEIQDANPSQLTEILDELQ